MKSLKKFLVPLAVIILVVGAFAGGYYLKASASSADAQYTKLKPPPDWTEWKYPNSQREESVEPGGVTTNNWSLGPSYLISLSTPDDLESVLKWYAKKFDSEAIVDPMGVSSGGKFNTSDPDECVSTGVIRTGNKPDQKNPVRTKVITRQTARSSLVVTISRNEGGSHTHILVAYFLYSFPFVK